MKSTLQSLIEKITSFWKRWQLVKRDIELTKETSVTCAGARGGVTRGRGRGGIDKDKFCNQANPPPDHKKAKVVKKSII